LLYVLAVDIIAVLAGLVIALNGPMPSRRDLLNAGVLLVAATAHVLISRPSRKAVATAAPVHM